MKRLFSRKIELSPLWTILLWLVLGCFILTVCVALQPGPVLKTLQNFLRAPKLLILNLFPVLVLLGLLTALLGNLFWAGSASSLVLCLLSLVNLIKVECRKDPLIPADFGLLREAVVATGDYQLDLHIPYLLVILGISLVLLLLGFKLKTRLRPWLRIAAGLVLAGLFAGSMLTVYPSYDVYYKASKSVPGLQRYNVTSVFNETGFLYCFLHHYQLYDVWVPEGYDSAEAQAWNDAPRRSPEPPTTDLVFVQCEAFTALFDLPIFDYPAGENPLALYHSVADSGQALTGRIVVSNFGAGTANTEFDVLTGVQTASLNDTSSALRTIHKRTASLARSFGQLGYARWFMHPGQSWFYNRDSGYEYLGFEDRTFLEEFSGSDEELKGIYVSDRAFGEALKARYEAHKAASDAPWFAFTVTIQNHQAFTWTKYPERPPEAPLRQAVMPETLEAVSVYAEGIRDSSRLLFELCAYFNEQADPLLLVFWGDHLPAMGKDYAIYRELGRNIGDDSDPASVIDTYTTPFLIWANRAWLEENDLAAAAAALELPADGRISDIFLGELVCELCGLNGSDPFWDFLGQLRRQLPVICQSRYVLADGTVTDTLPPELQTLENKLRKWCYYRVVEERVPALPN